MDPLTVESDGADTIFMHHTCAEEYSSSIDESLDNRVISGLMIMQ